MTLDVEARAVELARPGAAALLAPPARVTAAIRAEALVMITAGKRTGDQHESGEKTEEGAEAHAA
jgi:hypothetical protein